MKYLLLIITLFFTLSNVNAKIDLNENKKIYISSIESELNIKQNIKL